METIGSRVTRLITGSINGLIDAAENISPTMIMRESIKEVDSAISDIRSELGILEVKKRNIEDSLNRDKTVHSELLEQITTAIESSRDDLAEAGLGKQIDIEAQLTVLEEEQKSVNKEIKRYGEYIIALQGKKREMKEALDSKVANEKDVSFEKSVNESVSKADAAFNRINGSSSGINSLKDNGNEADLEELADLNRKKRIENRLDALKAIQKSI